jgi:hypothetical protein
VEGRAPGYDRDSMSRLKTADLKVPPAFGKLLEEVENLHAEYQKIAAEAPKVFPNHNFRTQDYRPYIEEWRKSWEAYYTTNPPPPPPPPSEDPCAKKRQAHTKKYETGAVPAQIAKIFISKYDLYGQGTTIVLKIKVQNLNSTPIYRPRLTLTGGLISEVVDLGFAKMDPGITTTIHIAVDCFSVDDYQRSGMPNYNAVLIYQESEDGPDKKAIQKMD